MSVLVVTQTQGDHIDRASLPGITAGLELAKQRGVPLHLLVLGSGVTAAATAIANMGLGAATVHVIDDAKLAPATAEAWADAIVEATKSTGATAVGGTATSMLRDALPRAAALLDAALAAEITGVTGASTFQREVSAGRAILDFELTSPFICFMARASDFEAPAEGGPAASVNALNASSIDSRGAEVLGVERTESARPALTEADVIVSGGRGMQNGENFKVLEQLTDLMNGALGASRAATDAGMVPADLQVGQTGKVVAPKLYIAVGISGAIQHLAGMKASKTIVAINKDPEAPIFQIADYGIVAKWEDTIQPLIELIKARQS